MHKDILEPFHPFYLVPLLYVTALLYILKKRKVMKIKGYHGHLSKKTEDILLNAVFVFSFAE